MLNILIPHINLLYNKNNFTALKHLLTKIFNNSGGFSNINLASGGLTNINLASGGLTNINLASGGLTNIKLYKICLKYSHKKAILKKILNNDLYNYICLF